MTLNLSWEGTFGSQFLAEISQLEAKARDCVGAPKLATVEATATDAGLTASFGSQFLAELSLLESKAKKDCKQNSSIAKSADAGLNDYLGSSFFETWGEDLTFEDSPKAKHACRKSSDSSPEKSQECESDAAAELYQSYFSQSVTSETSKDDLPELCEKEENVSQKVKSNCQNLNATKRDLECGTVKAAEPFLEFFSESVCVAPEALVLHNDNLSFASQSLAQMALLEDAASVEESSPFLSSSCNTSKQLKYQRPALVESSKKLYSTVKSLERSSISLPASIPDSSFKNGITSNHPASSQSPISCSTPLSWNSRKASLRSSLKSKLLLSNWGLPAPVVSRYSEKKITALFPWQVECLTSGRALLGGNLIYSAPTSSGKTLVSELLMLRAVLDSKKKGLYILPFVAVAREKTAMLKYVTQDLGIRVESFAGSSNPGGGFAKCDLAVCTIEKANSIVNRMMEDSTLDQLAIIVVDELHLIGDPHRGYLLELLLTKVLYTSSVRSAIQIVGMSATLPNMDVLCKWLRADNFRTDFRPIALKELVKIGRTLFDKDCNSVGEFVPEDGLNNDAEHVISLSLQTVVQGFSVLVFCPTKAWCETMAQTISGEFFQLGAAGHCPNGLQLRQQLHGDRLSQVMTRLKACPAGLDSVLAQTIRFGVAFHHAGLTCEERDIIEASFKEGVLRVLVATSTLSSGVNLPARRVIIRTPIFNGSLIDPLVYRQMIGRAGRYGQDSEGESYLICQDKEQIRRIFAVQEKTLSSCLLVDSGDVTTSMKRAMLEVIATGSATTDQDLSMYAKSTLLSVIKQVPQEAIDLCTEWLTQHEFIVRQDPSGKLAPTQLGLACLASSLSPDQSLVMLAELQAARKGLILDSDLHLVYQITPTYVSDQLSQIDWLHYLTLWEELKENEKCVGRAVGVEERFLIRAMKGTIGLSTARQIRQMAIHKRFYTALALHDLMREVSLANVAQVYKCNKGMLQGLQQQTASFAGMVTIFCQRLGWNSLYVLLQNFQSRLLFGVQAELCDLMRLDGLDASTARLLYDAGLVSVVAVATASAANVEMLLRNSSPFESGKQQNGKSCSVSSNYSLLAQALIAQARGIVQRELGVDIRWRGAEPQQQVGPPDNLAGDDQQARRVLGDAKLNEEHYITTDNGNNRAAKVILVEEGSSEQKATALLKDHDGMKDRRPNEELKENVGPPKTDAEKILVKDDVDKKHDNVLAILNCNSGKAKGLQKKEDGDDTKENIGDRQQGDDRKVGAGVKTTEAIVKIESAPPAKAGGMASVKQEMIKERSFISEISNHVLDLTPDMFQDSVLEGSPLLSPKTPAFVACAEVLDAVTTRKAVAHNDESIFESTFQEQSIGQRVALRNKDSPRCRDPGDDDSFMDVIPSSGTDLLNVTQVASKSQFRLFSRQSRVQDSLALTTHKDRDRILAVSVCWNQDRIFYVDSSLRDCLKEWILKMRRIVVHDIRTLLKDLQVMLQESVDADPFLDVELCHWLLDANQSVSLDKLFRLYTGETSSSTYCGKDRSSYQCLQLMETYRQLESRLNKDQLWKLCIDMEVPVMAIMLRMERRGIAFHRSCCESVLQLLRQHMHGLEQSAYDIVGRTFNISSSKQVNQIMLKYAASSAPDPVDRGVFMNPLKPRRRFSTLSKAALVRLGRTHRLPNIIVEHRKISSIVQTIICPLLQAETFYWGKQERIAGQCQFRNVTGRITILEPNLQHIPRPFNLSGTGEQVNIRTCFHAGPGNVLLSADYSQLELRILAHLSGDRQLCAILSRDGGDVFRSIAGLWKKKSEVQVSDDERQQAKQICYGIVYGMGCKTLAEQLDVAEDEAKVFVDSFHASYPGVEPFIAKTVRECRAQGFVETLHARRRFLPAINSSRMSERAQAERQAVNTKIQGSAADLVKTALILIDKSVRHSSSIHLVHQIHDELLFQVSNDQLTAAAKMIKHCMETAIPMKIALPVTIKVGPTWGTMQPLCAP